MGSSMLLWVSIQMRSGTKVCRPMSPNMIEKMYATRCDDCPIKSLNLYLSRLHPDYDYLFQRPFCQKAVGSAIWYFRKAPGVNAIGNFMVKISEQAELSKR